MNQDNFSKNKGIAAAFLQMAMSFQPAKYPDGKTPKGRYDGHRKQTKKGAKHKIGVSFKPRKTMNATPAQYRNEHRGNPEKAFRRQLKMEKRKWISA